MPSVTDRPDLGVGVLVIELVADPGRDVDDLRAGGPGRVVVSWPGLLPLVQVTGTVSFRASVTRKHFGVLPYGTSADGGPALTFAL